MADLWQEIQSAIHQGYAIAAGILGPPYAHYRPAGTASPLAPANRLVPDLPAAFDTNDYRFSRHQRYGDEEWTALVDGAQTRVGDYLAGQAGTFFICSQAALLPIVAVKCNRTVSVLREHTDGGVGAVGYGGDTAAQEDPVMAGWPASVLEGSKGEKGDVALPGDVRMPWFKALLPYAGVDILTDDILTDDHGLRYKVSAAELTEQGWRLSCMLAAT